MDYIEVCLQAEIKPDIGSRIIMWGMKADYSHALIRFTPKADLKLGDTLIFRANITYICEAIGEGVRVIEEKKVLANHVYKHIYRVPLAVTPEFVAGYINGTTGKEYSNTQLVGIAIMDRLKLSKLRLSFWHNDKAKTICSEYAMRFVKNCCGLKLNIKYDFVKPTDIPMLLSEYKI